MEAAKNKLLNEESKKRLEDLMKLFPSRQSVVLPVIHIVYDQFGYIDKKALKEAVAIMSIPPVYFEEASSFYTLFPQEPVGKYLIQVCQNISCTLMGAEELLSYLTEKLGIRTGETTEDKLFSLVVVECLGSCGTAPMMQINDKYYEDLTRAKVDRILDDLRSSK